MKTDRFSVKITVLAVLITMLASGYSAAQGFTSVTNLNSLTVSAITGEKPQSKVWTYAGRWWMVMPNSSGTQIWRLDGTTWTSVLNIDASTSAFADCKAVGSVTHILLYKGTSSSLVSVEYVPASATYQLWTTRNTAASISLDTGVETATIDIDSNGRMWLANAGTTSVYVRWSDSPYSSWSSPITLATGINDDDICAVTAFNGNIGVLWSNQNTQRFGFRTHADGTDPSTWSADEVPASQSSLSVGGGMADDHLNMAVASDGTIYCAVKTSYNDGSTGNPQIAMLVRRPAGTWDNLYEIATSGTRGIVILNESAAKVKVIYTSSESGGNILYRESLTSSISFGSVNTLMTGTYNNTTSTKQSYSDEVVVMAGTGSSVASVLATDAIPGLVAHWKMDETSGTTLVDSSPYGNNATTVGSPTFVPGLQGNALQLDGSTQYATAPNSASLDINGAGASSAITLAAWIKPTNTTATTQNIIKKANTSSISDGYELSLGSATSTWPQKVFFRLNQLTSGDGFRVNSTTNYPLNGTAWMHIAATFDGTTMKLYVNGVQEGGDVTGPAGGIVSNTLAVGIGAQPNASTKFMGLLDDARVYNRALTPEEIQALILVPPAAPSLSSPNNLATAINISPTLTWTASPGATSYQVQVSSTNNFSDIVFDQSGLTTTSASVTPALANSTVYYWRVNATNAVGTGLWSPVWSFTTIASVPAVESNGAGYTLDFDGLNGSTTSDYVNCGTDASLNITTSSLTIEAWIKPTIQKTHSIVKKFLTSGSVGYELFLANNASPNRYVSFRLNNSATYRVNSSTNYPIDGTWMHVAATYDYTAKTMKIFINGIQEGSITGPTSIGTTTNPLTIGSELSDFTKAFQGMIDEVRVWNVARSEADIKANMTKKLVGNEPGLVGYWRFDETSGTTINDETANNNDGTMVNMDPATDHVWSGAALGDASSYHYVASGTATATLPYGLLGEQFMATTSSGTNIGVQVYRADDNALRRDATVPAGYIADPNRFWGVRANGTTTPTFTVEYNYTENPNVTVDVESGLKLLKRASHSVNPWVDASASLNTINKTLTVTETVATVGSEYALAIPVLNPPASPSNLSVNPISGSILQLIWTDNSSDETGFEIERSETGSGGPFTLITTVPANTIMYNNTGLEVSVNYCYRVRAINSGGSSAYSNIDCETTTNGPITISLQDGVNGYSGTRDTYTDNTAGSEGTVRGAELEIIQDIDPADPDERRSLLLFDLSSIPDGTVIQSAELQLYVNTEGQGFNMYRMFAAWNEASVTYASLGNRHFAPNGTDAETAVNASWTGVDGYTGFITVAIPAPTIQAWVSGTLTNNGWLMTALHPDDGQRQDSRESATISRRPRLTIVYATNPPDQPELIYPADNSTGITTSPLLGVRVTDPEDRPMAVNYYGRMKEAAGETFTLVGLPDSQSYTAYELGGLPAMFNAQTQWVKDNHVTENIAFVTHFGDVVDTDNTTQWDLANTAMSILDVGASVPYGIGIGNHDATAGSSALYNTYFGVSRFEGRSYYGGHYGTDNDNNYELFSASGMDFVMIHLEYSPSTEAIQWADGILKANTNRRAIITSHNLIGTGNPGSFSTAGQTIYDELKDNPNLFLMLCGHVPGEGRRTDTYNGSVVHTLLADYQSDTGGGNGYLRVMEFSPQTDEIYVRTYSPYLNQLITDSDSQFTLSYEMEGNGFHLIGARNGIESGSEASITWNDLEGGTEYEWYVTVSNGENTITGPVWSFTTLTPFQWTGAAGTDFNTPGNWSTGSAPDSPNEVIIGDVTNDPIISDYGNCSNLIIRSGGKLTVAPGAPLNVGGDLISAGQLIIESDDVNSGSLIVNGTSTGTVTYNRYMRNDDRHLFSSPVGGSIPVFESTHSVEVYEWDEINGIWEPNPDETNFISGKGYAWDQNAPAPRTVAFIGSIVKSAGPIIATAPYSVPYNQTRGTWGGGGWNLLGNPFTSGMSAVSFITLNSTSFDPSYAALYVWDGPNQVYRWVSTSAPVFPMAGKFSEYIQTGQGFFVLAAHDGVSFNFNSTMQAHTPTVPMLKSAVEEKSWPGLQLKVKYGEKENSTLIVYNENMTSGLNPGYDIGQLSANPEVEIYTTLVSKDNDVNFAQQALPVMGADKIIIPIGIDSEKGGEVTFSAFTVPLEDNKFWLEDRVTGIFTNLNTDTYTVTVPAKTYGTGRFFIIASANTPTGMEKPQEEGQGVRIWTSNDQVIIKGEVSDRAICEIYNVNGKKILDKRLSGGELNTIAIPSGLNGVFIVRVTDGVKVATKKVAIL
jgi:hypothetical protein